MPKFDLVPMSEAEAKSTTGKRAELVQEYMGYLNQLQEGQAGRLRASEGETPAAVRRRLGTAAKLAGKDLVIRRTGEDIYFWVQPGGRRRRGRPRKTG
jgi:hypothetical protein